MYTVLRHEPGLCFYFDTFVVEQTRRTTEAFPMPPEMLHGQPPAPMRHSRTVTPEETLSAVLRDAGVDDAKQAEYQRRLSALLAGR
jgi:hypothetical protein